MHRHTAFVGLHAILNACLQIVGRESIHIKKSITVTTPSIIEVEHTVRIITVAYIKMHTGRKENRTPLRYFTAYHIFVDCIFHIALP